MVILLLLLLVLVLVLVLLVAGGSWLVAGGWWLVAGCNAGDDGGGGGGGGGGVQSRYGMGSGAAIGRSNGCHGAVRFSIMKLGGFERF